MAWSVPVLAERDTRDPIQFSSYGRCSFDARTMEPILAIPMKEIGKLGRTIKQFQLSSPAKPRRMPHSSR